MPDWALIRDDGFEVLRDPADTTGLLPVVHVRPPLAAGQRYTTYTAEVGEDKVTLTWTVAAIPPEVLASATRRERMDAARVKARAILADPVGSADWTVAERKVLLAVLILDLLGDA